MRLQDYATALQAYIDANPEAGNLEAVFGFVGENEDGAVLSYEPAGFGQLDGPNQGHFDSQYAEFDEADDEDRPNNAVCVCHTTHVA